MNNALNDNKLKEMGVYQYYYDLSKFINKYLNDRYPLNKKDINVSNIESTDKVRFRNIIRECMKMSLKKILSYEAGMHVKFGNNQITEDQYKNKINKYVQFIISEVNRFIKNNNLLSSNAVLDNKDNLTLAIKEGITGEAVSMSIEDIMNISDRKGYVPREFKSAIESIADMKDITPVYNGNYLSEEMKQNNTKIKLAIKDGLSSQEIASSFSKENDSKKLRFKANLVSNVKRKEQLLNKNKKNEGFQKKV